MPVFIRLSTWSFIRDISGDTTIVIPLNTMAGTWNVMDFPPPVGRRPSVSIPERTDKIISSWSGRKES